MSRGGHGLVEVVFVAGVAAAHHLHAAVYFREGLLFGASKLRGIAAVVAGRTVFEELRRVLVCLEYGRVGVRIRVIPLYLHLRVAVFVGNLVEFLYECHPFRRASAADFFVDEPSVEAHVFGYLIQFLGIYVCAVLRCEHLAHPCLRAAVCCRREENLS